jgi:hypothetical protein
MALTDVAERVRSCFSIDRFPRSQAPAWNRAFLKLCFTSQWREDPALRSNFHNGSSVPHGCHGSCPRRAEWIVWVTSGMTLTT